MKTVTIRFSQTMRDLVDADAGREGVNFAHYVREAALTRAAIASSRREQVSIAEVVSRLSGIWRDPPGTGAVRHSDKYVATEQRRRRGDTRADEGTRVIVIRFSDAMHGLLTSEARGEDVSFAQYVREAAIMRASYGLGQRGDPEFEGAIDAVGAIWRDLASEDDDAIGRGGPNLGRPLTPPNC